MRIKEKILYQEYMINFEKMINNDIIQLYYDNVLNGIENPYFKQDPNTFELYVDLDAYYNYVTIYKSRSIGVIYDITDDYYEEFKIIRKLLEISYPNITMETLLKFKIIYLLRSNCEHPKITELYIIYYYNNEYNYIQIYKDYESGIHLEHFKVINNKWYPFWNSLPEYIKNQVFDMYKYKLSKNLKLRNGNS